MNYSKTQIRSEIWSIDVQEDVDHVNLAPLNRLPISEQLVSAVYTTVRTFERSLGQTKYLVLNEHIQRLIDSLVLENSSFEIKQENIYSGLSLLDRESKIRGDLRIKIIAAPNNQPLFFFIAEPLKTPNPEAYLNGVEVELTSHMRMNPKAKSYEFSEIQDEIRSLFPPKTEEIIMVSTEGEILEGLSSNFYGIIDGCIHTAEREVLSGITRKIVLEIAIENFIPLAMNPIHLAQIDDLSECFITSTSRGILPVVTIGDKKIGPGQPGPITRRLMNLYDRRIASIVKPLYGFEESSSVSS